MSEPIRIVLADDHALFREGLKHILAPEPDLLVTAEAARADQVGPAVADGKADVLLLDLRMPGQNAVQTLLQLKDDHPGTRTMILTAYLDRNSIINTAKAGARGYLSKEVPPETLFQAVRAVHAGGVWIDDRLPRARDFAAIATARSSTTPPSREAEAIRTLSRRELEVLKLLAEGLSNEEIAGRTFISERTVKAHVTSIFAKLKVNNRVKAALAIIRGGGPFPAPAPRTRSRPPISPAPRQPGGPVRDR